MKKFKMTIQIGKNVTDIINLPCVESVRKNFEQKLVYAVKTVCSSIYYAMEGDLICQDYDNSWHVLTDKEYSNI